MDKAARQDLANVSFLRNSCVEISFSSTFPSLTILFEDPVNMGSSPRFLIRNENHASSAFIFCSRIFPSERSLMPELNPHIWIKTPATEIFIRALYGVFIKFNHLDLHNQIFKSFCSTEGPTLQRVKIAVLLNFEARTVFPIGRGIYFFHRLNTKLIVT